MARLPYCFFFHIFITPVLTEYLVTNITVGLLLRSISSSGIAMDYRSFKPPFDIAVGTINNALQPDERKYFRIKYVYGLTETDCGGNGAIRASGVAANMYFTNNIQAIFGPLCSSETASVADIAAYWNVPILSGSTSADYLEDRSRYLTFTRTSYKQSTLAIFVSDIFGHFDWNAVGVLQDSFGYWNVVGPAIVRTISTGDVATNYVLMTDYDSIREALQAVINKGRGNIKAALR